MFLKLMNSHRTITCNKFNACKQTGCHLLLQCTGSSPTMAIITSKYKSKSFSNHRSRILINGCWCVDIPIQQIGRFIRGKGTERGWVGVWEVQLFSILGVLVLSIIIVSPVYGTDKLRCLSRQAWEILRRWNVIVVGEGVCVHVEGGDTRYNIVPITYPCVRWLCSGRLISKRAGSAKEIGSLI